MTAAGRDSSSESQVAAQQGGYLFIVGAARTGSTLLRHVLNRHPRVAIASETHFMEWLERSGAAKLLDGSAPAWLDREKRVRRLTDAVYATEAWRFPRRQIPRGEFEERLGDGPLEAGRLLGLLLEFYGSRRSEGGDGLVVGEKTPEHLRHVPQLAEWFPSARFIHTFRDPRAIFASELRRAREGRWGPKARWPWLPGPLVDPVLPAFQLVETTRAWREAVRRHHDYRRRFVDRYLLIRFEDLVGEPEPTLRRIFTFLDLPFDERVLTDVDVVGSSFHDERHVAAGFEVESLERWRTSVAPWIQRWFALAFRRELRRFGYRP